jgi:hypothetical protein
VRYLHEFVRRAMPTNTTNIVIREFVNDSPAMLSARLIKPSALAACMTEARSISTLRSCVFQEAPTWILRYSDEQ